MSYKVGDIKYTKACGACGPAVQALASCTGEFGPEWTYAGEGTCGDCSFNCVDFGLLGNACTVGTHAKCKKISYTADQTACCLGLDAGNPKRTCDPNWNVSNPICNPAHATYCSVGDRILSDKICTNWANIQPAAALQQKLAYCSTHLDDPRCKDWCRLQNGLCDSAVTTWCATHTSDPYCTCLQSRLTGTQINPVCMDRDCIMTGYQTQNMKSIKCPDITDCTIQATAINSGVSLGGGFVINQNCGNGQPNAPTQERINAVQQQLDADASIAPQLLLFLFIIFVIVGLITAVYYAYTRGYLDSLNKYI